MGWTEKWLLTEENFECVLRVCPYVYVKESGVLQSYVIVNHRMQVHCLSS